VLRIEPRALHTLGKFLPLRYIPSSQRLWHLNESDRMRVIWEHVIGTRTHWTIHAQLISSGLLPYKNDDPTLPNFQFFKLSQESGLWKIGFFFSNTVLTSEKSEVQIFSMFYVSKNAKWLLCFLDGLAC
jgi:hypothetical protein